MKRNKKKLGNLVRNRSNLLIVSFKKFLFSSEKNWPVWRLLGCVDCVMVLANPELIFISGNQMLLIFQFGRPNFLPFLLPIGSFLALVIIN